MRATRQRLAEPCPRHPDSKAVKTKYITEENSANSTTHCLAQHFCAEEECGQPTGWHYNSSDGSFIHGSGRCTNPYVLHKMREAHHDDDTHHLMAGLGCLTVTAAVILYSFIMEATGNRWDPLHTIAAATFFPSAAAMFYTLFKYRKAKRPSLGNST